MVVCDEDPDAIHVYLHWDRTSLGRTWGWLLLLEISSAQLSACLKLGQLVAAVIICKSSSTSYASLERIACVL